MHPTILTEGQRHDRLTGTRFFSAQARLENIRRYVEQAADSSERIDRVERELFAQLLELGLTLLRAFVAGQGDGDVGASVAIDGAELRHLSGPSATGRERVFVEMAIACKDRDPERHKTLVCLLDGERALWEMAGEWLPRAVGVLDLFHVLKRLWTAAHCFHSEGSPKAAAFVAHRLTMLLQGKVGHVIGGLRRLCDRHALNGRWDEFIEHHVQTEQDRLYGKAAA